VSNWQSSRFAFNPDAKLGIPMASCLFRRPVERCKHKEAFRCRHLAAALWWYWNHTPCCTDSIPFFRIPTTIHRFHFFVPMSHENISSKEELDALAHAHETSRYSGHQGAIGEWE